VIRRRRIEDRSHDMAEYAVMLSIILMVVVSAIRLLASN
jgi:hypothetical protein